MKKTTTFLRMLLAAGIALTGFSQQASATHAAGADLTYINVAPNIYVLKYRLFRDCSGIPGANSETITYRAPGCNANNQTLLLPKVGSFVGSPYCNNVVAGCTSNGLTNYEELVYSGTLTL